MDLSEVPEPVKELLACLEIFMEQVDYKHDFHEWWNLPVAERHSTPPPVVPNDTELTTAHWQVTELVMQLLSDHLELIDLFQAAAEEAQQVQRVGEIIRPQLYVPGQP